MDNNCGYFVGDLFYIVILLFAIPAYKAYKVTPDEVIVEEITTDIEERY